MEQRAFDLRAMFIGDGDFLIVAEIAFRTAFMFLYALALLRVMGKRGVSQLAAWEYAIIVAPGSAVGDPMIYPDVPLLHGCTVITTVVVLQWVLTRLSLRNHRLERVMSGTPVILVRDGRVMSAAVASQRVSRSELAELLRMRGVPSIDHVEWAVLEDSGSLSVILRGGNQADPSLWDAAAREQRRDHAAEAECR